MKRTVLTVGFALLLGFAGIANSQSQPVGASKSDFTIVIKEFDRAMCKKLGTKETEFSGGAGAITRAEVIATMDELLVKYQDKFRVTPRPFDVYPEVIDEFNKSPETRESLRKLSKWGMIGPVSRLVANKGTTISEEDLGDALGYFYSRVLAYSYQPDPDWTPDLQGGE